MKVLTAGPVIVLVDDPRSDGDAIEWAAAEAAIRGSDLRIVHAFRWPYALDPIGDLVVDPRYYRAAEAVVAEAADRAHEVDRNLRVTTDVYPGRVTSALVKAARRTDGALVVVGPERTESALVRRLARHGATTTVIGSSHHAVARPISRPRVGLAS
jgi:nucleotide-binding universal stress UspA family protein